MKKNYYHIKKVVKSGWTRQPNAILRDENLTSDAKVVIYELLSVSGEYHISESGLASSLHMSVERVKKAIKLLKSTGYIQITHIKEGSRFGGCEWGISDTSGNFHKTENHTSGNRTSENPANGNSASRKITRREFQQMENPSKYIYDECLQGQNHQGQKDDERQNQNELLLQPCSVAEVENSPCSKSSFSSSPSSGAEAPSHSKNHPQQGDAEVISSEEYLFRKFLDKYPKAPLSRELDITRKAFYEIPGLEIIFDEIMAGLDAWIDSSEWNRDGGRWIKKPLNFIRERQWEKVNLATESAANKEIEMLALKMSSSWNLED